MLHHRLLSTRHSCPAVHSSRSKVSVTEPCFEVITKPKIPSKVEARHRRDSWRDGLSGSSSVSDKNLSARPGRLRFPGGGFLVNGMQVSTIDINKLLPSMTRNNKQMSPFLRKARYSPSHGQREALTVHCSVLGWRQLSFSRNTGSFVSHTAFDNNNNVCLFKVQSRMQILISWIYYYYQ